MKVFKIKTKKAFTLIELLVTIAIVGILATLALSSFQTYRDYAAIAEMKIAYGDVVTAMETIRGDLEAVDPGQNQVTYTVGTTVNGTFQVTTNNTSLPDNLANDFLAGLSGNRTRYWMVLNIIRNTGYEWYSGGSASCATSPGVTNYVYYRREYSSGSIVSRYDLDEVSSSFYGEGGTYCP